MNGATYVALSISMARSWTCSPRLVVTLLWPAGFFGSVLTADGESGEVVTDLILALENVIERLTLDAFQHRPSTPITEWSASMVDSKPNSDRRTVSGPIGARRWRPGVRRHSEPALQLYRPL